MPKSASQDSLWLHSLFGTVLRILSRPEEHSPLEAPSIGRPTQAQGLHTLCLLDFLTGSAEDGTIAVRGLDYPCGDWIPSKTGSDLDCTHSTDCWRMADFSPTAIILATHLVMRTGDTYMVMQPQSL